MKPRPIRPPLPDQTSRATVGYVASRRLLMEQNAIERALSTVDKLPWCRCGGKACQLYRCPCGHLQGEKRHRCGGCSRRNPQYVSVTSCNWCGRKVESA